MLVVIDVDTQKDFMNEDTGKLYVPGAEDIKENISKVVNWAAIEDIPILKTMDIHEEGDKEFETFPPHCIMTDEGSDSIKETSLSWTLYFPKKTYDIFDEELGNADFEEVLKDFYKADEAIVFGVATDYCVKACVLGLLERGIDVTVVKDAIAGVDTKTTNEAIYEMKEAGAKFKMTEELI